MGLGFAEEAVADEPHSRTLSGPRRFGDYELLEEIGRGGMGVVYRARQISLNRIVAVKMLPVRPYAAPEEEERLHLEAEVAGGLHHPNIVTVYEFGEHEGQFYFAMEYVEGQSLAQVTRHHSLSAHDAARYLKTIAEAVHVAHEHGILHRDLKPSNILVDLHDQIRITDFGLAKRLGSDSDLTLTGQLVGSPNYLSPEQAAGRSRDLTPRSDVYALGALLYQLLTGRPPLIGASLQETLLQIREKEAASPRLLKPGLPRDLETICLKCLQKEPARRYAMARDLAEDLGRFLQSEPIRARPVSAVARGWRWCRRKPALAGMGALVVVLLLAITAGAMISAARFRQQAQETRDTLWKSYLDEARLSRASGQQGQRFRTLETLAKAAAIRVSPQLRSEAIAALAVPDVRPLPEIGFSKHIGFAFDATCRTYAECSTSAPVVIRQTIDGRELSRLPFTLPRGSGAMLSPSGRYFARCSPQAGKPNLSQVWDVGRTSVVCEVTVPERGFPVDFSPDGRLAAFGLTNQQLLIWDLSKGSRTAANIGLTAHRLDFHPDGTRLAAAMGGRAEIALVDTTTGEVLSRLKPPGAFYWDLNWSADGQYLAVGCREDSGAYVVGTWEEASATWKHVLRGHSDAIIRVNFIAAGHSLVTRAWGGTARLWDADTGLALLTFPCNDAFAWQDVKTNRLAFQVELQGCELHELVTERECRLLHGHSGEKDPWIVAFSPDGQILASGGQDGIRLWDPRQGKERGFLGVGPARSIQFLPGDGSLVAGVGGRVECFPLFPGSPEGNVVAGPAQTWGTTGVQARDSRIAVSLDGSTLAWVVATGVVEVRRVSTETAAGSGFAEGVADGAGGSRVGGTDSEVERAAPVSAASPAGSASGASANLTRSEPAGEHPGFGPPRPARLTRLTTLNHGGPISALAISPDGRWIVTGGGVFKVWALEGGQPPVELAVPGGYCQATFSPDGRWLALGTQYGHQVRAVATWNIVLEMSQDRPTACPVAAFTRDGRLVALAVSPHALRLLEVGRWTEVATIAHPSRAPVNAIGFSPDDNLLALACGTHVVQLWDLREVWQQLAAIGLDWDRAESPPRPRLSPQAGERVRTPAGDAGGMQVTPARR
jgi:WD40 repeat protein/predicted Ser/Thr protein kinase